MSRLLHPTGRVEPLAVTAVWAALLILACVPARGQVQDFELRFTLPSQQQPDFPLPSSELLQGIQVDPQLRTYLVQLEDPSFEVREKATGQLVEAVTDKLQLYALLDGGGLTAEQRYRLLAVVRENLIHTPRGALGISTNPLQRRIEPQAVEGKGIRIEDFIPGLPAEKILHIGDRITHIDDQVLTQMLDLQSRVQSKRPGEKVKLTVERSRRDALGEELRGPDGQIVFDTLQIEIELGSAALLRDVQARLDMVNRPNQRPQPMSVEWGLLQEAATVQKQFSPQPRLIPVQGGTSALLAATTRSPADPAVDQDDYADYAHPDVDRHLAIQALLAQQRQIAQGLVIDDPVLRKQRQARLVDLLTQARQPNIDPETQRYLMRVVERYRELMAR